MTDECNSILVCQRYILKLIPCKACLNYLFILVNVNTRMNYSRKFLSKIDFSSRINSKKISKVQTVGSEPLHSSVWLPIIELSAYH